MTTGLLFPGQGSELAPVVADWYERSKNTRPLLDEAAHLLGVPVARLVHGSGIALRSTTAYQPVMTAVCVGAFLDLRANGAAETVAVVAGHSLGELAACVAAGAMCAEDAVRTAVVRGRLMARGAERHPGGMVAITARGRVEADKAASAARTQGNVQIAAHNAPDEWVLSGDRAALRAIPPSFFPRAVPTDGPWHSNAMCEVAEEYRTALVEVVSREPAIAFVCNRSGRRIAARNELVDSLAGQLTNPVEWAATMMTLTSLQVNTFVTLGPAKALRGLVRRNLPAAHLIAVDAPDDVVRAMEVLAT